MSWFPILFSSGYIGQQEASLIIQATLLMLIVVVPVLVLLFFFAWHYRAGNTKARYSPNWEHSKMDELIWWAIPLEIVLVLGALTWFSTHTLDPRVPIVSSTPPITIQVVALEWKWLFIYPSLGIATTNFIQIPVGTPINFEVTADAPMNSFWVPQLGGQIYAMTGMQNQLHLMATEPGDFKGTSANYSGEGFAQMSFVVRSGTQAEFDTWTARVKQSNATLASSTYATLRAPSTEPVRYYSSVDPNLFHAILMQFVH